MRKWAFILLLAAVSCVKEKETEGDVCIRFQATACPMEGDTKATPAESLDGSFGIRAYTHATRDGEKTLYAPAVEMTPSAGVWTGDLRWPGYGHGGGQAGDVRYVSFYAFSPYSYGSRLQENWLADVEADGEKDLLVSASGPLDDNPSAGSGAISLPFRHAFTGVRFQAAEGYVLSDITLTGILSRGDYNLFTGAWENQRAEAAYAGFAPEGTTPGEMLLLLPQTLSSGAEITMKVSYRGGTPETLTLSDLLEGTTWHAGTLVTYLISQVQYTYEVGVLPAAGSPTTMAGGKEVPLIEMGVTAQTLEDAFQINSYKVDEDGVKADVPWTIKAVYSDPDLTQPVELEDGYYGWLQSFDGEGGREEAVDVRSKDAPVDHTEYNEESIRRTLRSRGAVGSSSNPRNLANRGDDGTYPAGSNLKETANCYIVNRPGWYKFPLVMGNSVKNNALNTSAYRITSTDPARMLGTFQDYQGNAISSPVLSNPRIAAILWADRQDLIDSYSLYQESNGLWWIKFRITQSQIDQGNVVFAAMDYVVDYSAGMVVYRVMWSWHIWVTDYVPGQGDLRVNSHSGTPYTFMPLSLGWTELGEADMAIESTLYVQLETENGLEVGTVAIRKAGGTVRRNYLGRAPTYQWGRKDPVIPGMGTEDYDDISGMVTLLPEYLRQEGHDYVVAGWTEDGYPPLTLGQSIQAPHVFRQAKAGADWCSTSWINRWNAAQSGTVGHGYTPGENYTIVKTIYDPSPAGYHVPHAMAFTGLTKSGGEATSLDALNLDPADTSVPAFRGYNFKPDGASDSIVFPIAGYRSYNGDYPLQFNRSGGITYYWSAETYNREGRAYALYLVDTRDVKVNPLHTVFAGLGAYVRPVRD